MNSGRLTAVRLVRTEQKLKAPNAAGTLGAALMQQLFDKYLAEVTPGKGGCKLLGRIQHCSNAL